VQIELIRRSLKKLGSGEKHLTHKHYNKTLQLASNTTTGKKIELPNSFIVTRTYQHLKFEKIRQKRKSKNLRSSQKINVPGLTTFEDYLVDAKLLEAKDINLKKFKAKKDEFVEWFDYQRLNLPLSIRYRQTGDRFWPLGLPGQKRIGKFLTSEKVPYSIREKVIIIRDNEKIIWVWPVRTSEEAKVSKETQQILQLKITFSSSIDNNKKI
jgi:tRNA(Ile)-lysidine synthase